MVIVDQQYGLAGDIMKKYIIFLFSWVVLLINGCSKCGYERTQVINGLKNYQSVVGFVRNCGSTTPYSINVTFVNPGMDLGDIKADVFSATHSVDLYLEKVSEDTIKIIFCALKDDIFIQEKKLYGVHFIYENNCRFFNKNNY